MDSPNFTHCNAFQHSSWNSDVGVGPEQLWWDLVRDAFPTLEKEELGKVYIEVRRRCNTREQFLDEQQRWRDAFKRVYGTATRDEDGKVVRESQRELSIAFAAVRLRYSSPEEFTNAMEQQRS